MSLPEPSNPLLVLLPLLVAHLLVDFVVHREEDLAAARPPRRLIAHSFLAAILSYVLVGNLWGWILPAAIFAGHLAIDYAKARWGGTDLASLALDQSAHLLVLIGIASFFGSPPVWETLLGPAYHQGLAMFAGISVTVPAGRVFVGAAVEPFLRQLSKPGGAGASSDPPRGFAEGGAIIGQLERALILLFILVDQPTAIGFLIAAKSVFRFGELRERSNRMEAEYIIIGTMMSFLWGVAAAYLTQMTLEMLGG